MNPLINMMYDLILTFRSAKRLQVFFEMYLRQSQGEVINGITILESSGRAHSLM